VAEEFTCAVDKIYCSACKDLPKYSGSRYCVLHDPAEEKDKEAFEKVKKGKLDRKDYDFRGTVFPEDTSGFGGVEFHTDTYFTDATFIGGALFQDATFSGGQTSFDRAQFSGGHADFKEAQFSGKRTSFEGVQFSSAWGTSFSEAQFSAAETSFSGVQFSSERTDFSEAQFSSERTEFQYAQFGSAETSFQEATFAKKVDFSGVTFSDKVTFWGTQGNRVFGAGAWAQFDRLRIEKPEQITFKTVLLHPCWFINADVRKVDFTDVKWYGMPGGPKGTLNEEIDNLKKRDIESPHTLLAQACRRLSANAEENREYPLANEFHYWSMDALRKEGSSRLGLIGTLYWALSGYGVRAARAFWMLVGIWAVFTTLYVLVNPSEFGVFRQSIGHLWQAGVYSLLAMARLNPEPRPDEPGLFQLLVGLEGIFGPLQIALLALAIRRKVMR
jgi:uncharacterized protein YjbI with pentapeptide repeats